MGFPNKNALHEETYLIHGYHRPEYQETMDDMGTIRQHFAELRSVLINLCPVSRELSMALSHLDEGNMCAIAALARHEAKDVPEGTPNTTSHPLPGDPGYESPPSYFDNPNRNEAEKAAEEVNRTHDSGQKS